MNKVDILITGSSRPQLIPYCVESIQRFIVSQAKDTEFKWFLHEDAIIPSKSEAVVKFAEQTGLFEKVVVTVPSRGLGHGMDLMIKNHITAPYMLYVQEDFEIERTGIDIDRIIWTMERHPELNYIIFNKIKNGMRIADFQPEEFDFDGLKLTINNACHFIPSFWRMCTCRGRWSMREHRPEGHFVNQWGDHLQRSDIEWSKKNMGCYFYGGLGEYPYVSHNGATWRMAEWRRDGNKPGGKREWDVMRFQWRAPWVLKEARPVNKSIEFNDKSILETDSFKKIYKKLPDNIKKNFGEYDGI